MNFKKGDRVAVLDDVIEGEVVQITETLVSIATTDGFTLSFAPHELIKTKQAPKTAFLDSVDIDKVISEKESASRKKAVRVKPKERNKPALEVDLHIHKLTRNDQRMSSYEKLSLQLDTAKSQLEFAIKKRLQKVVFIHGVGEGVLRLELETLLRRYDNLKFYDADYKTYGFGATEVYIYQNVAP